MNTKDFFKFDGDVVLKGGLLKLNNKDISDAGIGSASKLIMAGGAFSNVGKNEAAVTFSFPIVAEAGTTSTINFDRWNVIKCNVSGTGTLQWGVCYLREYIEGNWDNYAGKLIITSQGNYGNNRQFAIRNGVGIKNATIFLKSGTAINGAKNQSTYYLGGLSGDAGSSLSGFNVKAKGEGTWIVGGANTDETFRGVIDDKDQAGTHPGKTSIVKDGAGDWRLTGSNTYSGTTKVAAGTLIVNGTHSGTGAITVNSGATLAGKGTLTGAVTMNGTLMVGDTLVTDKGLTFKGALKLGSNAILQLNDAKAEATYTEGDQVRVFTGTATGTFKEIIPATPGEGLEWDTTSLSTGILKVVKSSGTTGISEVKSNNASPRYNLNGQPVKGQTNGLFIQDGKIRIKK